MNTESDDIKSALAKRTALVLEIQDLGRRRREIADKVANLELTCDLDDAAALGKITGLCATAEFLPRRIENREQALENFDDELLKTCHDFIMQTLGPRLRNLEARAIAKVKAKLKPNFSDDTDLDAAIAKSSLVKELEDIQAGTQIQHNPAGKVIVYAHVLLKSWKDAAAFESKLATAKV